MPRTPGKRTNLWAQVAFYSSLGFILPAFGLAGFGLGWILDRGFGTSPVLAIVLCLVGAGAGVVEVVRILLRAENQDDAGESDGGHEGS